MGEIRDQMMVVHGGKMEEMMQAIAVINMENQKNKLPLDEGVRGSER